MRRRKEKGLLLYVVRFNVMAKNVTHAVTKIKGRKPTEIYVDEEWKEGKRTQLESAIGFDDGIYEEDDEELDKK